MKVVLVSQFFPPETAAGANRAGAMAAALADAYDVRVATLEPGYPRPDLYDREAWREHDRRLGIPIRRGPAFAPHGASLARRALREVAMSLGLIAGSRGPADLVIVSTPSMFLGPLGFLRARLGGARFAWDVRDLTWRYAQESVAASRLRLAVLRWLESAMLLVLRRADLVIAATPGLGEVLLEQGIRAERMITVPNGVTRALLDRLAGGGAATSGARPRVTYVGLMGYNHGIGILLDVARLLPEVDVVLVGDGPERPAIETRLRESAIPNVRLHDYVTDAEGLARHYLASDVLVNHTQGAPILNRIVNPAKLFEYFASGRPVVYAGAGYAARFLTDRDLAVVVPPDDPAALARGIRQVLADPDKARERSRRARDMIEREFTRETQMRSLVEELRKRFGSSRGESASR